MLYRTLYLIVNGEKYVNGRTGDPCLFAKVAVIAQTVFASIKENADYNIKYAKYNGKTTLFEGVHETAGLSKAFFFRPFEKELFFL